MLDKQTIRKVFGCHIRDPPKGLNLRGGDKYGFPVRGPPKTAKADINIFGRRSRIFHGKLSMELLLKLHSYSITAEKMLACR